jgi:hypothetical protein
MRRVCILFILGFVFAAFAQDRAATVPEAPAGDVPEFKIKASIDIQAQKALWDDAVKSNLDQFWGRINFGGVFTSPGFNAALNIRAYPEGFGYEALTGVSLDSWLWKVQSNKTEIAKFQITDAWVQYVRKYLSVKVGLFETDLSQSCLYGNYLDADPNGSGFISKITIHNALEFSSKFLFFNTSVMLGASDKNLNRGYLRLYEELTPFKGFSFAVGYRGNVFDKIQYENETIRNRVDFLLSYEIIKGLKPYFELGVVDEKFTNPELTTSALWDIFEKDTTTTLLFEEWIDWYYQNKHILVFYEQSIPILIGITIPTGKFLDVLAFELEINARRKVTDLYKPVEMNLFLVKSVGARVKFTAAVCNDPLSSNMGDFKFGLRFSSKLN